MDCQESEPGVTAHEQQHTQLPSALQELIASDLEIIPGNVLNRVTRGPLRDFILQADHPLLMIPPWKCLFRTFSSDNLPSSHMVAICNAVSAFLDATTLSANKLIREFALSGSQPPWIAAFEVLLDRYERKPKPMRQVLTSLIKIILGHRGEDSVIHLIRSRIVQLILPNIVSCEPRSRLKACLVSLEWLIRKEALPVLDFIQKMNTWMLDNPMAWISRLEGHCIKLGVPMSYFIDVEARKSIGENELLLYGTQIFTISLLLNSNNRDLALPAGTLFTLLCHTLDIASRDNSFLYISPRTSCPFWQAPLRYIALQNIDDLDAVSDHFLYPLFKVMPSGFQSFIRTLPFYDLQAGSSEASPDELIVLFAALQIAKELGLVQEDRSEIHVTSCEPYIMDSSRIGDFLIHPEPAIRISALSLLITAPSTRKPFSSVTLQVLAKNFPYMHTDSDPQYRGEVYSLIRKLIIRLCGGLSGSRKTAGSEDGSHAVNDHTTEEDSQRTKHAIAAISHVQFLQWYVDFLELELQPTMSYQRHISALKTLALVLQSGLDKRIDPVYLSRLGQDQTLWNCNIEIFRPSLFRVIGDLLINPYDDVRSSALILLNMFPRTHIQTCPANDEECFLGGKYSHSRRQLVKALQRAENVASRTSRADHADAVARLYHILFDLADFNKFLDTGKTWYEHKQGIVEALLTTLEKHLYSNDGLFQNAIRETSLHGYISALRRYIVSTPRFYACFPSTTSVVVPFWRECHDRLILLCEKIWLGVQTILCIDSPEGQDEDAADELKGPKDLLSCSWRALRESSMLLHAILLNSTYAPESDGTGLVQADFNKIGSLSFTQLAELRHRGAFSAVSQTFTACCQRCGQSKDLGISNLLDMWYKDALKIIDQQASKLTRRSAGLPALITGLASSQPDSPLFRQIMRDVQEIASLGTPTSVSGSELKLPQVHALNCLKDIFTNTKLGPSTESYVMPCLMISAECLRSKIWAIRNCGLMLFKALINRMCRFKAGYSAGLGGSSGSELGSRIVFQKYPGLVELLAQLLQDPIPNEKLDNPNGQFWEISITTERVFPALELIGEKVPSFSGEEEKLLRDLVCEQFRSPVWGIREHSARIYASLLRHDEILPTVCELSTVPHSSVSQNHIHGTVLCIRYSLQRLWVSSSRYWLDDSRTALLSVKKVWRNLIAHARSPFVLAALVDVLNDVLEASIRCGLEGLVALQISSLLEEHGVFDMLANLLSQAKAENFISKGSFILIRAISISKTTISLAQNSALEGLLGFLNSLSSIDVDTTCLLLTHMHHCFSSHERTKVQRITLYTTMIEDSVPRRVQSAIMRSLADSLESLLETHTYLPDEFSFLRQWARSTDIPENSNCCNIWNRDMVNASLRLKGSLFALQMLSFDDAEIYSVVEMKLNKWNQSLRSAIADETEFTTRHAAVLSMKAFVLGLKISARHRKLHQFLLDTYLVLYGMLNDDDEDIRYIATQAAGVLFSLEPERSTQATELLPLAASLRLTEVIAEDYVGSTALCVEALGRFLALPINISAVENNGITVPPPVSRLLASFQKESTVLFQEEKQNLFIEDVREVEIWSKVLSRLIPRQEDTVIAMLLYSWVAEGLSTLIAATRTAGSDCVLGWISNPDVFTLGVRVLRGAKILLLVPSSGALPLDKALIYRRLEDLLDQGRKHAYLAIFNPLKTSVIDLSPALDIAQRLFDTSYGILLLHPHAYHAKTAYYCNLGAPILNHAIVLILILIPVFAFIIWRVGLHLSSVFYFNMEMHKVMRDTRQVEEAVVAQESQVATTPSTNNPSPPNPAPPSAVNVIPGNNGRPANGQVANGNPANEQTGNGNGNGKPQTNPQPGNGLPASGHTSGGPATGNGYSG
ncbi:hypothetical protein GX48_05824 [Paracoccidioides brasiliensis]|nr:hypothetical protein GX48_05824 [Paracoccidioides brasiliensis]